MNKADMKAAARKTQEKASETVADLLAFVAGERGRFEQRVGRYEVLAAVALSEGFEAQETIGGKTKPIDWAAKRLPGASSQTTYRWVNAGRVARVLMGDGTEAEPNLLGDLPVAMVGSLVPLYRVLALSSKSDDARAKGRTLARSVYSDLLAKAETITIESRPTVAGEPGTMIEVKAAPTMPEVLAAAEKVAPSNRSGGSKATEKAEQDEETTEETTEDEETETRRESASHLLTVDPAAIEAATGPFGAIFAGLLREHEGLTESAARAVGLAVIRLGEEHGYGNIRAILAGAVPSAEETTEKAETEQDEATVEDEAAKVSQEKAA